MAAAHYSPDLSSLCLRSRLPMGCTKPIPPVWKTSELLGGAAGVGYLDFADAADLVFGVTQFDVQAKAAGVFVLSGVRSFPVLTAAVLRETAEAMDIVAVEGGIAPSPNAGIGLNVMRAVVGYAGAPVKLWRNGRQAYGIGLAGSMRFTIAVPGRLALRNIHSSLIDVPDLQVIPPEHETLTGIWMGAGPVPESLHRILNLLAKMRRRFGLPSLVPFSRIFYAVLNRMRSGEHRGGMFVRARGIADGRGHSRVGVFWPKGMMGHTSLRWQSRLSSANGRTVCVHPQEHVRASMHSN